MHFRSYGLFQMFDDVMFLAKGGHTVYLGPVSEIEAYFSSHGFIVPERINPPDYYMDALEGLTIPQTHPSPPADPRTLPILWMMHKGYRIPTDMVALATEHPLHVHPEGSRFSASFAQEACLEIYQKAVVTWDGIKSALSRVDDLSGRKTPGFWRQFRIILHR